MQSLTDDPKFDQVMALYSCAIMEVETKFNVLNTQFIATKSYNPIDTIKTRLKSVESIEEKLARRDLPVTLESMRKNLFDVAGIRVICPFEEDIYAVADFLLEQDDVFLLERKDYIKRPKSNGYRSLHLLIETPVFVPEGKTMVRVEVQLRTIAMELWAELEHRLRYKQGLDPDLAESLAVELRDCADDCASLDARMGSAHRKIDAIRTFVEAEKKEKAKAKEKEKEKAKAKEKSKDKDKSKNSKN